ncbi:MAG: AAA family ATPase, partial [Bacteroidetes bacterium]|nr:AAA family ATPase [Bacteroidota bacterium]
VKIPINEEALKEALDELQKLVGLSAIKKQIDEMVKLARYLDEQGEDIKKIFTEHILFLGNPGTGKTTVARIYGKIYSALGILPKGHLVETDRQGLVAGYVGQTAEKTTAIIDKSIGGMLFLDEAYALIKSGDSGNDFGKEAIDILLKRMEDDRGKFIVIAAGYTDEMNRFVASNPGMQSRFSKSFFFEDYSPSELMEIAKRSLARDKKVLSGSAEEKLFKHFEDLFKNRDKKFGNARIVRNILEAVKQKMLLRLSDLPATERTEEKHYTVEGTDISEVLTQEIEAKQFEVKGDPLILQEHINELNKLIGLEDVKKEIYKLISFFKISQLKKEKGLHSVERNLNSIFIGNEGVGKRTVVNILAKILKELGVLKKEQVVEVERHDLIGGYPGQTEIKTDKVIQQAFGGILFVKDAKALFDDNSFGKEAVETIFKRLFDYKNKFILVLSGTKSEIELIFKSDSSIKAKLPNHFYFEDFTPREMLGIASNIAEKKGYSLDEGALQELLDLFSKLSASKKEHLNNVVLAKHLFYAAVTNQEERIFNMYEQNDVDLTTITLEDVEKINL